MANTATYVVTEPLQIQKFISNNIVHAKTDKRKKLPSSRTGNQAPRQRFRSMPDYKVHTSDRPCFILACCNSSYKDIDNGELLERKLVHSTVITAGRFHLHDSHCLPLVKIHLLVFHFADRQFCPCDATRTLLRTKELLTD